MSANNARKPPRSADDTKFKCNLKSQAARSDATDTAAAAAAAAAAATTGAVAAAVAATTVAV